LGTRLKINFPGDLRWRVRLAVCILLGVLFALLLSGVQPLSFTADEPAYIVGGYTLWSCGQESLDILAQRGYTPLLAGLEALLFYAAAPNIPVETLTAWPPDFDPLVNAFKPYLTPLPYAKFITRIPTIWLTILLAALVFRWGKDLWGVHAGLLVLVLLTFDPTLLAHGRLATTDVGVTALGTAALYLAWRWLQAPTWSFALGTGVLLGLAMLAKVSAPLWAAVAGVMMLIGLFRARHRSDMKRLWVQVGVAGGIGLLIWWAGYGFTWGKMDVLPFAVPAPAYWKSALYLVQYKSEFFALGRRQVDHWWWYFPLTFVLKNPLPLLLGCAVGLLALRRRLQSDAPFLILLMFPVLYTVVAIAGGMDIGYRHMLPIHPFLYLLIGRLTPDLSRLAHAPLRFTLCVLLLWYIIGTLRVVPHELAYFNEWIGGSANAYRYLADSNLDWGESTEMLAGYVETHPEVHAEPPATKFLPAPGRYIVGASYLQGLGIGDPYAYAWFRQQKPVGIINANILIYDVPSFAMTWLAQCGAPSTPLDEDAIVTGIGPTSFRRTGFDCTQAWLYPAGGTTAGLYALAHSFMAETKLCLPSFLPCPTIPADPFIARHVAAARLSFDKDRQDQVPPFVLYEMSATPLIPDGMVYVVPVERVPEDLSAETALATPVVLDGPLNYLGTATYRDAENLEIETWWQVTAGPITRPFSIMAHLLSPQGDVMAVADGLGVWPSVLATGDIFVQRHDFPLSDDVAGETWLRTGAYWLDTLERWAIQDDGSMHEAVLLENVFQPVD